MGFESLISILAELYPTEADARRIASQSGIDLRKTNTKGSAIQIWYEILVQAGRQDRTLDLLSEIASPQEYGDNRDFLQQYARYSTEIAKLAILANDQRGETEEFDELGSEVPTVTERRMDNLEDNVRSLENDVRELKTMTSQVVGEMKQFNQRFDTINHMLEAVITKGAVKVDTPGVNLYLILSFVAIGGLLTFAMWIVVRVLG